MSNSQIKVEVSAKERTKVTEGTTNEGIGHPNGGKSGIYYADSRYGVVVKR